MATALILPFAKTHFCRKKNLQANILNLLSGNALLGMDGPTLPNVFIGDEAFELTSSFVTSVWRKESVVEEKNFHLSSLLGTAVY
jgi:hypothetical protein